MSAVSVTADTKSPEAFRTISEVADDLDVPQHVLRFWETRFAQIRPLKRAGGRRYYRPEDIELLRGIRTLLYGDGYTIKGVQRILREQGVRYVAEVSRQMPRQHSRRVRLAEPVAAPRYARKAIERLQQARTELESTAKERQKPDNAARRKLEALLGELVQLKGELRTARERLAV
ncbi:MAG: MerR family transcriptional regulator [Alphaproteobacteria bacterium]|nr:MerR family transcriptional regulator [Alphaproteobacteria bacterium]